MLRAPSQHHSVLLLRCCCWFSIVIVPHTHTAMPGDRCLPSSRLLLFAPLSWEGRNHGAACHEAQTADRGRLEAPGAASGVQLTRVSRMMHFLVLVLAHCGLPLGALPSPLLQPLGLSTRPAPNRAPGSTPGAGKRQGRPQGRQLDTGGWSGGRGDQHAGDGRPPPALARPALGWR